MPLTDHTGWTISSFCSNNGCLSVRWQKSTYCGGGECLETRWQKSSRSGANGCVEARHDEVVQVRDSKLADTSPILNFHPKAWGAFIGAIRNGDLDRP